MEEARVRIQLLTFSPPFFQSFFLVTFVDLLGMLPLS